LTSKNVCLYCLHNQWQIKTARTNNFPNTSLFDSLFDPLFTTATIPTRKTTSTNTKVSNEKDRFIISVAAPGLDKEDFNISVTDGVLTVAADKATTEFGTTTFTKTWTLPDGAQTDKISADYKQGILRVNVLKPEVTTPETTTIQVN
jgi:HSP20 family protein